MKKLIFATLLACNLSGTSLTSVSTATVAATALTLIAKPAMACDAKTVKNCGVVVPDIQYHGGGVDVPVIKATACFDIENQFGELYIVEAIQGHPYTADFVYNPAKGSYEIIKTVDPWSPCWTHNVPVGTWMAVYVTCRTYTGWVAVKITGPGIYTMVKVPWSFVEVLTN